MAKKDKLLGKIKVFGVKTKVNYNSLDLNTRVGNVKEASKNSFSEFIYNLKTILTKPVRHVTHLSLVIMILIVLSTAIPATENTNVKRKPVDPFGVQAMTAGQAAYEKATSVTIVANIVSTIDTSPDHAMTADAYQVADQQAAKTSLALSGTDSIASLPSIETTSSASNKASSKTYVVQDGDTLSGIATKFGVTSDSIKWSNGMTDADFIKPGQSLSIPSITGIIYTVKSGDSIEGIASKYKAQAAMIIAQNDLEGEELAAGMKIVIPDGQIEDVAPAPAPSRTQYAIPASSGSNRFPWGYCTWYVASRRSIPWNGHAYQWYGNAIAYGRAVGSTPVPGAVMVTWESSIGHVAYVESVSGGTFTVSEMNYVGYGRTSSRTLTTSSVPLIGFIY